MGTRDQEIRQDQAKKSRKGAKSKTGAADIRHDTEQVISHNKLNGKPKTK